MNPSFDPVNFLHQLGLELIASFGSASLATTPGTVGSVKEKSVRKKLEQVLPRGFAVGTGFVIDSFGSTSKQTDVVIYERDICPVYTIDQDESASYFPCEGVIAVGEIKSSLSTKDLRDGFAKISSAKRLQRRVARLASPPPGQTERLVPFRRYCANVSGVGTKEENYNQAENPRDQIFGFLLAGSCSLSPNTLAHQFVELVEPANSQFYPNLVATLDGTILSPSLKPPENRFTLSLQDADGIGLMYNQEHIFQWLLLQIYQICRTGRTVTLDAFDRYIVQEETPALPLPGFFLELERSE